jgi:hypothetical protein
MKPMKAILTAVLGVSLLGISTAQAKLKKQSDPLEKKVADILHDPFTSDDQALSQLKALEAAHPSLKSIIQRNSWRIGRIALTQTVNEDGSSRRAKTLKYMLENDGLDPNSREQHFSTVKYNENLLMLAAEEGGPEMVQLFLDHGASINDFVCRKTGIAGTLGLSKMLKPQTARDLAGGPLTKAFLHQKGGLQGSDLDATVCKAVSVAESSPQQVANHVKGATDSERYCHDCAERDFHPGSGSTAGSMTEEQAEWAAHMDGSTPEGSGQQ